MKKVNNRMSMDSKINKGGKRNNYYFVTASTC